MSKIIDDTSSRLVEILEDSIDFSPSRSRTYNPSGQQNALSDIKRLLTTRDTASQGKACGYIIQVVNRYPKNSEEEWRMIEYLLDNDVTVFLCEATSNLDFTLFKSIILCLRSLWRSSRFFSDEHAAHAASAVLRALTYYASSGPVAAVETCLHFLCDLLSGIKCNEATSPLCHQSAFSAVQLLSCINSLIPQINTNPNAILSSALVLQALISYQPENLHIKGNTAKPLVESLKIWLELLVGALNHSMLVGNECPGMFYVIMCQLGIDAMSLTKLLRREQKVDFVSTILSDAQETNIREQCASDGLNSVIRLMAALVEFTQEHQSHIATEEYGVFLKFLLNFFHEVRNDVLPDFCDMLFSRGYLTMLPQVQIKRNDTAICKVSTLVIGEMLKVLSDKYLNVINDTTLETSAKDIHLGLVDLQYGIEKPQYIGLQFQKGQPYSLLIYIYFYCQSSENPEETMAPLLPYLVEHILMLPKTFVPPPHIVKALWLVFAMSTISNDSLKSLEQRVYVEKATERLVSMLHAEPSRYYTHNPAILLWAFTSSRIPNYVRIQVLSQWLKYETEIPSELTVDPAMWELLLNVLVQSDDRTVVVNCMECLRVCVDEGQEIVRHEFTKLVWVMVPDVLARVLVSEGQSETNISYLLELATKLLPIKLDPTICLKTAVLITVIFSKNATIRENSKETRHFEYVCLKLSLYLLGLASNQNDNRVLLTYVNRVGYLPSVLSAADSSDERVACSALQLLSYVVHYFNKNNYRPKSVLQIQTSLIIQSLRRDSNSPRAVSLLQLVYMMLNSGTSPIILTQDIGEKPPVERQCNALRALMIRIQLMLCCRDSENQSSAGWKTLSSIFKHAVISKNDTKLVSTLTSQPWTLALIQYQITQSITTEFLTFLHNWLTLLKITVMKDQEECGRRLSKNSLVTRTMMTLKKSLGNHELAEKSVVIVKEILRCCSMRI